MTLENRPSLALQLVSEGHQRDAAFLRNFAFLGAGVSAVVINIALSVDLNINGFVAEISGWAVIVAALAMFVTSYFQAMWATYEAGLIHDERVKYVLDTSELVTNIETANAYLGKRQNRRQSSVLLKWTARVLVLSVLVLFIALISFLISLPLGF
ncbi:hypothetical protein [Henriciella sp.]|uniref:hypothetical protein n=1 Tax=Henriciella sp. TaxID=1968823 RepID=UPI00261CED53|nr:hypothetical protein [Henriciella sp.]